MYIVTDAYTHLYAHVHTRVSAHVCARVHAHVYTRARNVLHWSDATAHVCSYICTNACTHVYTQARDALQRSNATARQQADEKDALAAQLANAKAGLERAIAERDKAPTASITT